MDLFKRETHKYQIYAEVMSYDNDFSTIYGEEEENNIELAGLEGVGEPILLTSDNDNDSEFEREEDNTSKSDIKIPKYMQDSETSKVTYCREE